MYLLLVFKKRPPVKDQGHLALYLRGRYGKTVCRSR
jgi:hypothetical protein